MSSVHQQTSKIDPIVHSLAPVTLVGGAIVSPTVLKICLKHAPESVAADGGANALHQRDLRPLAVIGDLDSLSDHSRAAFADIIHPVTTQETTDFEKALTRIQAPLILAVGFLGGRLDHTFAALNVLIRHADRPVILLSDDDLVFAVPLQCRIDLPDGSPLALLPMAATRVSTRGLVWNLQDQVLSPAGLVSSSNAVEKGPVTIASDGPLIVTLPVSVLPAAIDVVRAK